MLVVILFILGLASACLIAYSLLKRFINDEKKRKVWSIVTYVLLALITIASFFLYINWMREQNKLYDSYVFGTPYATDSQQDLNSSDLKSTEALDLGGIVYLKGETNDDDSFVTEMKLTLNGEQAFCEFTIGMDSGVAWEDGDLLCSVEREGENLITIYGDNVEKQIHILPFEKDFSDKHITAKITVGQKNYMATMQKSSEEECMFY